MTPNVFKWTDFAVARGIRIAAILLIALILNRLLRTLTRRLIPAAGTEGLGRIARMREQHVKTLAGLLYSAGTAIILIGAILTALPEFGFNVTPIAAAAGLASLAIGFGAQHLVRDLINGFFIIIEDQFVVGESVRIGTVIGRVEHLTLRRTVVRDPLGAVVTIPNGEVTQVSNLSRDWGQVFVDISIPQETSSDAALAALERACVLVARLSGRAAGAGRGIVRGGGNDIAAAASHCAGPAGRRRTRIAAPDSKPFRTGTHPMGRSAARGDYRERDAPKLRGAFELLSGSRSKIRYSF